MRAAIEPDDSRFVDHFRLHHDRITGLDDLIVAVVTVGDHRRHGGWKEQAAILESHIGRRGRIVEVFQAIPLGRGRCRSQADDGVERVRRQRRALASQREVRGRVVAAQRLRVDLPKMIDMSFLPDDIRTPIEK